MLLLTVWMLDLQVKFAELMNSETDLTSAVLSLINITQSTAATQSTKRNKPSVADEVREIIAGIMDYNSQQTENTNCVVPTYTLVNKIAIKTLEKEVHRKAVNDVLEELNDDIATRLSHKEITGLDIGKWNGKYHRKDMKSVIGKIVTVLNQQYMSGCGCKICKADLGEFTNELILNGEPPNKVLAELKKQGLIASKKLLKKHLSAFGIHYPDEQIIDDDITL